MGRRFTALRLVLATIAVGVTALAQVAAASAEDSFTTQNFSGSAGGAVFYSPAAACLGSEPRDLELQLAGFMHVNGTGAGTALHVVADLDVTFSVTDRFPREVVYQGHGDLRLNEFVEMNWSSDQGFVSKTLSVDLVAPDGSSVPTLWTIEIWAGRFGDSSVFGSFGWGPGYVSCP